MQCQLSMVSYVYYRINSAWLLATVVLIKSFLSTTIRCGVLLKYDKIYDNTSLVHLRLKQYLQPAGKSLLKPAIVSNKPRLTGPALVTQSILWHFNLKSRSLSRPVGLFTWHSSPDCHPVPRKCVLFSMTNKFKWQKRSFVSVAMKLYIARIIKRTWYEKLSWKCMNLRFRLHEKHLQKIRI